MLRRINPTTPGLVSCDMEPGGLPSETLARAFRELTGLIVQPIRLTGLYWQAEKTNGRLFLVYRCAMRGGEVAKIEGQPSAGFFDTRSLPPGLVSDTQRQIEDGLRHSGGRPVMARLNAGPGKGLRHLFHPTLVESENPVDWAADVRLVIQRGDGRVAWIRRTTNDLWTLPAKDVAPTEAPWEAAGELLRHYGVQYHLAEPFQLPLILLDKVRPAISFIFSLGIANEPTALAQPAALTLLSHISQTAGFHPADVSLVEKLQAASDSVDIQVLT